MIRYLVSNISRWTTAVQKDIATHPNDAGSLYAAIALCTGNKILEQQQCSVKDCKQIFYYLSKSANYGNAYGLFLTSLCLLHGDGCKQDQFLAGVLNKQSADLNNADALNFLAINLFMSTNYKEALQYFYKAQAAEYPNSACNIALCNIYLGKFQAGVKTLLTEMHAGNTVARKLLIKVQDHIQTSKTLLRKHKKLLTTTSNLHKIAKF